jgi:kynurenine formamidase
MPQRVPVPIPWVTAAVSVRGVRRPPLSAQACTELHERLSNWERWGPDDQLGALNFVTPDVRTAAAAEVRSGLAVSCARPLNTSPAPDNPLPVAHHMTSTVGEGYGADYFAISPHGFATSHIDALCHIFHDGRLYNGYPADAVTAHGATKLGIHHLADGVITRGVLLDIPALRGVEALQPGEPIYPEDLDAAERAAGLQVRRGDALLVRTGRWRWRERNGPWEAHLELAGLDATCLQWIHDREVSVLGSDGVSDVFPSGIDGFVMPVHTVAIVSIGLHLLDNLDFDRLAEACAGERRWSFLFVVAPLVLPRGTASPVNPIAVL